MKIQKEYSYGILTIVAIVAIIALPNIVKSDISFTEKKDLSGMAINQFGKFGRFTILIEDPSDDRKIKTDKFGRATILIGHPDSAEKFKAGKFNNDIISIVDLTVNTECMAYCPEGSDIFINDCNPNGDSCSGMVQCISGPDIIPGECQTLDCAGVPNGGAEIDACGVCDGGGCWTGSATTACGTSEGDYCDCSGNTVDACGICDGSGCWTGSATIECSPFEGDYCDCDGTINDACNVCGGSGCFSMDGTQVCGTSEGDYCDCSGNTVDACGICGGDDSTCLDCNGNPNGGAVEDECGVCEGPNDGTTPCYTGGISGNCPDWGYGPIACCNAWNGFICNNWGYGSENWPPIGIDGTLGGGGSCQCQTGTSNPGGCPQPISTSIVGIEGYLYTPPSSGGMGALFDFPKAICRLGTGYNIVMMPVITEEGLTITNGMTCGVTSWDGLSFGWEGNILSGEETCWEENGAGWLLGPYFDSATYTIDGTAVMMDCNGCTSANS